MSPELHAVRTAYAELVQAVTRLTEERDGLRLDLALRDDEIASLEILLAEADRELADLRRENAELRQEIDAVTDRERDAYRGEGSR